ncbi:hypothetical protein B0H12DRAFT_1073004 [Mycena haematopus]|nr:hypothetical protein B0H12DRAFT_1073004 [Mycena haematopus]
MRLPQELVDTIIDFVDELETLRSCALVSHSFYNRARLFSRLQIGPRTGEEHNYTRLCELLEGSPLFAARVKSISLCDCEKYHCSWIAEADLSRLLSLVSLTRLHIRCTVTDSANVSWPSISVANRHSIQATLSTLTSLDLRGVTELPLTLLSSCSSALRSLALSSVYFTDDSGSAFAPYQGSPIPLEHLSLDLCFNSLDSFVPWILSPESPVDISYLRSLECTIYMPLELVPIQRLLDATATSLQRLCLGHYESFSQGVSLDLHALVHLYTLSLVICPLGMPPLSNLVFPPQQALALVLDIHIIHADDEHPELVRHLGDADRALAALSFKTVTVTVSFRLPKDEEARVMKKLIDVSDELIPEMPLLASKLGRAGALRILKSFYFFLGLRI